MKKLKFDSIYPDTSCTSKYTAFEEGKTFWIPESLSEKGTVLPCPPPISRLRVEKIEGGLMVAGVVVAANCQVALPVFGCLFILVGIVLTVASYRGQGSDENPENYAARLAFTGNSRVLGPACIVVGFIMLAAGVGLCLLTRRARRRERRVGFHCPVHGDFYPLSPVSGSTSLRKSDSSWALCFGRSRRLGVETLSRAPPQCPHTQFSSTRSSLSSGPPSPCPTPMPFLVTSGSVSSSGLVVSAGANLSPDQTFGSIRSLSVSREVASFPLSRTPSPPLERTTSPPYSPIDEYKDSAVFTTEDEEVRHITNNNSNHQNNNITTAVLTNELTEVHPARQPTAQNNNEDNEYQPKDSYSQLSKGPRKSVSIILPDKNNG